MPRHLYARTSPLYGHTTFNIAMEKKSRHRSVVKFGNALRKIRLAQKLTQMQMAADLQIDIAYLSRIERGEKDISLATAAKIAEAVGLRIYFGDHRLV